MRYLFLILFIVSFYGWCLFFNKIFNIKVEVTPILVISSISSLLFLIGLLMSLKIISYCIFVAGLLLFIFLFRSLYNRNTLIFIGIYSIAVLFLLLRFRGQLLIAYDDFSHWGLVVKTMLSTNYIPREIDKMIVFQTYPLGSSLWIYYVSLIISNSESIYLFAQGLIIISGLSSVFPLVKNKHIINIVLYILFCIYALTINIRITTLCVDSLLPIVSLAYLSIYIVCNENNYFPLLPISIFLCQIKASGIIFYLIITTIVLVKYKKSNNKSKSIWVVLSGLVSFVIWRIHLSLSFADISQTKHSLTFSYLMNIFSEKSVSDCFEIFSNMIKRIFVFESYNKFGIYLLIIISVLVILSKVGSKEKRRFLISIFSIYFIYFIGLYCVYMFSMPLGEAKILSSFFRYISSISMLIIGMLFIYINYSSNTWVNYLSLLVFIYFAYNPQLDSLYNRNQDGYKRVQFYYSIKEAGIEPNKSYLIIDKSDLDDGIWSFSWFSVRYDLFSNNIYSCTSPALIGSEYYKWDDSFDYLIINDVDEESNYYLREFGYDEYCDIQFAVIKSKNR